MDHDEFDRLMAAGRLGRLLDDLLDRTEEEAARWWDEAVLGNTPTEPDELEDER